MQLFIRFFGDNKIPSKPPGEANGLLPRLQCVCTASLELALNNSPITSILQVFARIQNFPCVSSERKVGTTSQTRLYWNDGECVKKSRWLFSEVWLMLREENPGDLFFARDKNWRGIFKTAPHHLKPVLASDNSGFPSKIKFKTCFSFRILNQADSFRFHQNTSGSFNFQENSDRLFAFLGLCGASSRQGRETGRKPGRAAESRSCQGEFGPPSVILCGAREKLNKNPYGMSILPFFFMVPGV